MELKPDVEVIFKFVEYKKEYIFNGYRPAHLIKEGYLTTGIHNYYNLQNRIDNDIKGTITFLSPEDYKFCLWVGKKIKIYEGKNMIGYAIITNIFNPILKKKKSNYKKSHC